MRTSRWAWQRRLGSRGSRGLPRHARKSFEYYRSRSTLTATMATTAAGLKRLNGDTVKTRPQRRLTQAELDAFLEKAADLLRGGVDHSEFRGYVFALLFYKRINDVYLENVAALEKDLGDSDLARDPRMHDFVVPDDCIWQKVADTTERDLGKALNDAMRAIERANEPK